MTVLMLGIRRVESDPYVDVWLLPNVPLSALAGVGEWAWVGRLYEPTAGRRAPADPHDPAAKTRGDSLSPVIPSEMGPDDEVYR